MASAAEVTVDPTASPVTVPATVPGSVPAQAVQPPQTGWRQRLAALDRTQRIKLGVGVFLLLAMLLGAAFYGRQPDYRVLFAGLSDKDGGAIVAQLNQMNVPYKYGDGTGAIMIPADRVHDVRLRLATQGLPKGTVAGFELMESNRFGITQFQERLNFQRGLEGELTRSIQALSSVESARVHLALPNQNGFFREQQKPSASVLVSLHPGRVLDKTQLAGIVHLVASSVPELAPSAVSVLDDTGKLLSSLPDAAANATIDAQQLMYVQQLELQYARRIMDILEPVVGRNNVKAQVSAELDFSQTESTSEQYRPNQSPDAGVIRSQQVLESQGATGNALPTGVPGAVTNQPPQTATAPVNGANPPPTAAAQQTATTALPSRKESTTNYEVDKTVRVTRGSTGNVKRLTAAVVVNYQAIQEDGKLVTKALTPEQLAQMTALVRETIGFNQQRGDSVNLMNAQFQPEVPAVEPPLWRQPEVVELAKSLAWPLTMLGFVALVLFGLIRPALRPPAPPAPEPVELTPVATAGTQLDALEAEMPERPALAAPTETQPEELPGLADPQIRLEKARELARQNPLAVANILKSWVNGDAPSQ